MPSANKEHIHFAMQDTLYYLPAEAHALGWQQQGLADRLYTKALHGPPAPAHDKHRAPPHDQLDQAAPTYDTLRELHAGQDRHQDAKPARVHIPSDRRPSAAPYAGCVPSIQATGISRHAQPVDYAAAQSSNADSRAGQGCSPSIQAKDTPRHTQPNVSATVHCGSADNSDSRVSQNVVAEQQVLHQLQGRPFQLPEPFVQRPRIGSRLFVQSHFPGIAAALAAEMVSWQTDMRIRHATFLKLACFALELLVIV